jgi:hypothetical protein
MTKESEMKLTMRPAGYTLLNHRGNDALEELKFHQSMNWKQQA